MLTVVSLLDYILAGFPEFYFLLASRYELVHVSRICLVKERRIGE